MTSAQAAEAPVLECPASMYGPGGAVNSTCLPCPGGKMAPEPGATDSSECTCEYDHRIP
jgi:hypothetical protein